MEVRDLAVERGGAKVLHNLTLSIAGGKVTGLIGPSGSGKTTLIRCIVGVQRIASGSVRTLGLEPGSAAVRRRLGYVTQAVSVYRDLTVEENLRYFRALVGASAEGIERILEDVSLSGYRHQRVDRLSSGQQSRVSLATAMVGKPDLLVLDEPTVGLDPVLREDLWQLFHRLADSGTTLLVSSHVMDESDHCEHLLLLRDGRLLADESPAELRARTGATDLDQAFLRLVRDEIAP